jgi:hypothetical protein
MKHPPNITRKRKKKERRECISKNETPIGISISYANIKHEINHELKFHKLQEDDGCVEHKVTTSL